MKFPHGLGFESLDPVYFSVREQGPCFTAIEEGGGNKRFVELDFTLETDGVTPPDSV